MIWEKEYTIDCEHLMAMKSLMHTILEKVVDYQNDNDLEGIVLSDTVSSIYETDGYMLSIPNFMGLDVNALQNLQRNIDLNDILYNEGTSDDIKMDIPTFIRKMELLNVVAGLTKIIAGKQGIAVLLNSNGETSISYDALVNQVVFKMPMLELHSRIIIPDDVHWNSLLNNFKSTVYLHGLELPMHTVTTTLETGTEYVIPLEEETYVHCLVLNDKTSIDSDRYIMSICDELGNPYAGTRIPEFVDRNLIIEMKERSTEQGDPVHYFLFNEDYAVNFLERLLDL